MNASQHSRAKEIFLAALQRPGAERGEYIALVCGPDQTLRNEVESLLAFHDSETILPQATEPTVRAAVAATDTMPSAAPSPSAALAVRRSATSVVGKMYSQLFGDRKRRFFAVLAAGLFLVAIELLVYRLVQHAMQQKLRQELSTLLAADLEALRIWFRLQESTALATAADPGIRANCQRLVELAADAENQAAVLLAAQELAQLRAEMQPLLSAYGYLGFAVVDRQRRIVAASENGLVGDTLLAADADELERVFGSQPRATVVLPFPSVVPLLDLDGRTRPGVATMFAVAPLRDAQDRVIAAFGLRIRPDHDFTRILNVAQAGESGETFAFDRTGMLLSESRFDEQLKKIGLLPDRPLARSLLQVELRDPGVDMIRGMRPALRRADQPLTRIAAEARAGRDGVDVAGFRDYRGVPVVGAWKWLPDEQFGVATKIDAREAFAPLFYLQWMNGGIMVVLGVALAISLYSSFSVVTLRRQVQSLQQVGPYRLEKQIGEGGMGQVFLAQHNLLRRPTAVKLLKAEMTSDRDLARFEREVQTASQLTHPNTIEVYDFGRTPEGVFYYAMEYLPGLTLEELIQQAGAIPVARSVFLLRQIARSLREAHELGLIHRDIKPQNIMLTTRGGEYDFVKVLDFGLAKEYREEPEQRITQDMNIQGTPLYIAPEILRGATQPDPRVDVYAVGVVAYYLLTGRAPFRAKNLIELFQQVLNNSPAPLSQDGVPAIPAALGRLVLDCLAKNPDQRPCGMQPILDVLDSDLGIPLWTQRDAQAWWQQWASGDRPSSTST